jgi:ATP:ADP antiporter, AAA family
MQTQQSLTRRLLPLQAGEGRFFLILVLLLFGNSVSLEISGVVSVSGFVTTLSPDLFLIVWGVDMLLIISAVALQSLIIDRFDRVKIVAGTLVAFALFNLILLGMFLLNVPGEINYTLLYLLSDQQLLFFPLLFWILANDVFNITQAPRLFPRIAAAGFLGQIVGLGISASLPALVAATGIRPFDMLLLNALIYALTFVVVIVGLRNVRPQQITRQAQTVRETLTEGLDFVQKVTSFRYLMYAMVAIGFVITVLEFHFLRTSSAAFARNPDGFTTFYSLYRLGIAVLSMLIQTFVTGRVLNRLTLKNSFVVLPITALSGLVWAIIQAGLVSAAGARAMLHLVWLTLDESSRKAFQALVPEARRGRVSLFMDSYLYAMGTVAACIITGIIVLAGNALEFENISYIYLGIAALSAGFAIWAIFRMRKHYDMSLFNPNLSRRKRGQSVLDKLEF